MKYWRGYLVAAILAISTWALREFARTHTLLVDMIYPYMSRMVQSYLAWRSSQVSFCLWQVLLLVMVALLLLFAVLLLIYRKNPLGLTGWVCAGVAALVFLHTGLYGLNRFSGSIAQDVRMMDTPYTLAELENATVYYLRQANALSEQVVGFEEFEVLAVQAADGFDNLVYDQSLSVFSGSVAPVKKLSMAKLFSACKVAGVTVGLTGEATVNPNAPGVVLPFEMCRQMAKRMCITVPRDGAFAAYLACRSNPDVQFQYSGMLMSYRYCLKALEKLDQSAYNRVRAGEKTTVSHDIALCDGFLGEDIMKEGDVCDLLVSWHIDKIVLPAQNVEQEKFDPLDKEQVGEL